MGISGNNYGFTILRLTRVLLEFYEGFTRVLRGFYEGCPRLVLGLS
jgi:hypothetical protein